MDTQSTIENVRNVLQDVSFPARKDDVENVARNHGVSEKIVGLIQQLPDEQFGSMKEVLNKLPLPDIEGAIDRFL